MAVVAVVDAGARIVTRGGAVCVEKGSLVLRTLQPHEITELQVHGDVEISAAARALLLREGIEVAFFSGDGRFRGRQTAAAPRNARRRLDQYAFGSDPARTLALARRVVAGKITNQRALLLTRQKRLRDERLADVILALRASIAAVDRAADLDVLRGVEGAAARAYFRGFAIALVNPVFRFVERNRRPPRDPVNAALSFGYALLVSRVDRAVWASGLEPWIGALHEPIRGAPALSLDLAEEWRPVVDGVVLGLFNRRQLAPEDFRIPPVEQLGAEAELPGPDPIWLGDVARTVLIRAWAQRLEERVTDPCSGDQWPIRAVIDRQAQQVARIVSGEQAEPYRPVALAGS